MVQSLCSDCHSLKTRTDAKFDDGWRPFVSIFNVVTYEGFHMQPREKPLNLALSQPNHTMRSCSIDFEKHYRHALMYPGQTWSVFAPTDSWTAPTAELAEWSWGENAKIDQRRIPYIGPCWYPKRLVSLMLQMGGITRDDIKLSLQPTTILPEDVFQIPLQKILNVAEEMGELAVRKNLFNHLHGMMVNHDEEMRYIHHQARDIDERPPGSWSLTKISVDPELHDWVQCIEQRSYDSMRPIHSR